MLYRTILHLPVVDPEHVPVHIRIDKFTTDAAARGIQIRGKRTPRAYYQLWKEDVCIMIGSADEIANELGTQRSMISQYAQRKAVYDKEFRIVKVN